MSKPASKKSSLNPWEALLASATRAARPPQDSSTSSSAITTSTTSSDTTILRGGYTILLQYSMTPKSQRKWALESTIANVVDNSSSSSGSSSTNRASSLSSHFASSLSIQQQQHNPSNQTSSSSAASARRARGDWYGISGPFLVRQAFHDLSKKCNGRVVLVSVAGTSGIWDMDQQQCHDNENDVCYQQSSTNDDKSTIIDTRKLFRQNGACVDLNSNPFGWNDDELNENEQDANNNHKDTFSTIKATLNNLQSIATAIRKAARSIEMQSQQQQQQQPIPIIFDSLTPLLHIHGAERIAILLKSLGRTSSLPSFGNNNNSSSSSDTNSVSLSCLSPIIAPILYESICPSDHRTLEDCADAMVHLNLMDSNSSSTPTTPARDDNSVVVVSGVLDLVRRGGGGGGSNGLGGKLMRHCVPVHILRSVVSSSTTTGDLRDSCYWIIDSDTTDDTERDDIDATDEQKGKKKKQTTSSTLPSSTADESGQSQSTENSSRPKIYLEDDDPDFQDYDEDDDLDL